MDGYPWWPSRVVTQDELILDETDEVPEVFPGSHRIEFFNDNCSHAVIHKKIFRSFLNPRYKKINMNYSGSYFEDPNVAIRECRDYVDKRGLKYKSAPKRKTPAAAPGRKIAPKRDSELEHSNIGSDIPEEEDQCPRKQRMMDFEDKLLVKVTSSVDTGSFSRKRKKHEHSDTEREAPPKPDKKMRVIKNEKQLEPFPVLDKARKNKPRRPEPTFEGDDSTGKKGHDGSRKENEGRQEDRSISFKEKPANESSRKNGHKRTVKSKPILHTHRLEVTGKDVKPRLAEDKGAENKERDGSEGGLHSGKNVTVERGNGTDSKSERGHDREGEGRSILGERLDSPNIKQGSKAREIDGACAGLSRRELVEHVNILENEVRSHRVELRQLRMGMGRTGDLAKNLSDFMSSCAPGLRAVSKLVTAFEKNEGVRSGALEKKGADAVEKLDKLLRADLTRELLKEILATLARRAIKKARRVLEALGEGSVSDEK